MSEIEPFDLHRMFIGDVSLWFAAEIVFRTVFIYLYTITAARLVSRRAIGQLSLLEFLLVIALGSAVGDPMFYPDVPLVHAMIVITVVVLLNRSVTMLINRFETVETALEGRPQELVTDGRIDLDGLAGANLNREKLFELLRSAGFRHLGTIRRAFMEQNGDVSFWTVDDDPPPGVRVTPPWDIEPPVRHRIGSTGHGEGWLGCEQCAHVERFESGVALPRCPNCEGELWVDAVVEAQEP